MPVIGTILASSAIAVGALGSLALLVLCFAGAPNSSDAQLRMIYLYMGLSAVGGLACIGGGIALIVYQRYWWAGIVGALPMAVLFGLIAWVSIKH